MTAAHSVDVLVPVHSASRPLARLVASALDSNSSKLRLTIIAHNVAEAEIEGALGERADDERVRVIPFADGVRSPAGPLNFGLSLLEAPFFTKIDSDDYLGEGAIDSWLAAQAASRADLVIPTMRLAGQRVNFPTPPARPRRRSLLHPVLDRLAYRTSTMGLFRSSMAEHAAPSLGLTTGEDILPSLRLWFSGARIAAAAPNAPYIVGEDALDRVTVENRSVGEELAFVELVTRDEFLNGLPADARNSIAAKLIRVQLFGAVEKRTESGVTASDLTAIQHAARLLLVFAPHCAAVLSKIDRQLCEEMVAGTRDPSAMLRLAGERRRYLSPSALTTRKLRDVARRDAPLRFLTASLIAQRRLR